MSYILNQVDVCLSVCFLCRPHFDLKPQHFASCEDCCYKRKNDDTIILVHIYEYYVDDHTKRKCKRVVLLNSCIFFKFWSLQCHANKLFSLKKNLK